MIIQVRGTSGSGKSTVVQKVMYSLTKEGKDSWVKKYKSGRKRPLYYVGSKSGMIVLGHYESSCGGCDTIGSAKEVYTLIRSLMNEYPGSLILCEGLLLSEDAKWSTELSKITDTKILFLTTPIDTCIEWINIRRSQRGVEEPVNETNTRNRVKSVESARLRLIANGVDCIRCSATQAHSIVLRLIRSAGIHK